uniref:Transferrin n=1 Tax=Hadrurus spadix TaxID=141984 RepID=A0A1W7R9D1_9SCOR
MAGSFLILSLFLALFAGTQCQTPKVRFCVPKSLVSHCEQMAQDISDTFTCVSREDRFDCMRAVQSGDADITSVDAQGIYTAGQLSLSVLAYEEVNRATSRYRGVALVKRSLELSSLSELRGKRSCHTGVHRTVGWQIPVTLLQHMGVMTPNCEGELATVAGFFSQSCAPHEWSPDPIVDAELKKKYPSLCALCGNPETCTRGDQYGGYEGSLRCLSEDRGDIAFSKTEAVEAFLQQNPEQESQLDYLCLDGSRIPVSQEINSSCTWGRRPSNGFVFSKSKQNEEDKQRIVDALRAAFARYTPNIPQIQNQERPEWFTKVLVSSNHVTNIIPTNEEESDWRNYLGDFRLTIDRYFGSCQPKNISFCTTSEEEQSKCSDLSIAAFSRRSNYKLQCVRAEDQTSCIAKIKDNEANLITLDGGDIYKAGKYSDLVPVAAEIYGQDDAKYYAVAVIRADSDINNLGDLRGKRSCHTGIGRTAGWVIPVSSLITKEQISKNECDRALSLSNFFSASCVPGANDTKYNPHRSGSEKLCEQCIGDESGANKCSRGSEERYSGYAGAFRCLAEGNGDVAFVKHTTVPEYTDGNSQLAWTSNLKSENYKLLCLNGGNAAVEDYKTCTLARVPSHYVMTSGSARRDERLGAAEFLALISKFLGKTSLNFNSFKEYEGKSDLLFKDSTTSLRAIELNSIYTDALGDEYYNAVESIDPNHCSL